MNSEGKIGVFEGICITTLFIINKMFYSSLSMLVKITGTAAWYTTIISCLVSLVFFYFTYKLIKRFPKKDFAQISEAVIGKTAGRILVFIFFIYSTYYSGSTLREFTEMIKAYSLPTTPTSLILITVLLTAVLLSYNGFEGLARLATIAFIPMIGGIVLILVLASPSYNFNMLKPYGGFGLNVTFTNGLWRSSAYVEFTILAFVVKALQGHKEFKKISLTSIILGGIILATIPVFYIATFGVGAGSENIAGMFELSRTIYFNRFFQRVESIFIFVWVISSVLAVSITLYMCTLIYCKVFKIKNHRPLLLPVTLLIYIIAILPQSLQEVVSINIKLLRQYSALIIYIPIVLIFFLALLFKKKGDRIDA